MAAYRVGVEISGNRVSMAMVDGQGTVLCRRVFSGHAMGAEQIVETLCDHLEDLLLKRGLQPTDVERIGIGVCGCADETRGVVRSAPALLHGDRAFDVYRRTAPAYIEDQQLHRTEPYVYSQTVNGKESYKPGEAKNSWLTGTAAWNFYAISQAVLGVKPELDGLKLDPCLPGHIHHVTIHREFRGNRYEIEIQNRAGGEKGPVQVIVDGVALAGQTIPATAETGKTYRVEVTVG